MERILASILADTAEAILASYTIVITNIDDEIIIKKQWYTMRAVWKQVIKI